MDEARPIFDDRLQWPIVATLLRYTATVAHFDYRNYIDPFSGTTLQATVAHFWLKWLQCPIALMWLKYRTATVVAHFLLQWLQWPIALWLQCYSATVAHFLLQWLQSSIVLAPSSSQSAFQPPHHSMEPPKRYEFVTAPADQRSLLPWSQMWKFRWGVSFSQLKWDLEAF